MSTAPVAAVPEESRQAWVVVWACFVALGVIFGVSYSFAAFFASLSAEFNARRADISLVFGLCGLVYFAGGAAAGLLADRFGPRRVCGAGMLVIAAGLAVSSLATSILAVYLAYGVGIGLGIALVYTPSIACVQPWFTRRRGLAAGIASAGIGAGTVVVPLLATALIASIQWRSAMLVLAVAVVVLGGGAALLLQRAPSATGGAGRAVAGHSLRQAMATPQFRWFYLMTVLGSPAMFVPFAHVSAAARDLGVPNAQAVGLVGLIGIGSLTGRFAIGALADRVGRPRTLALAMASMGVSYLVWMCAGSWAAMAVFSLWLGLSYGGIVSLMPALCMDLFGARAVSAIIGTLYTGAAAGNLLGPWVAGAVFDASGSYLGVIWGCMGFCALATAAAWRLLGPPPPPPAPAPVAAA